MILSAVNWKGMKRLAHEYRDFAIYLTPQNVTYYISQAIPVLILARFFGVATSFSITVGNFRRRFKAMELGIEVISLHESVKMLEAGTVEGQHIVITFDDGYLDGYSVASPS